MDKFVELNLDNFILLLEKNRRLVNFYQQQYKKIIPLKTLKSKLEGLLVTFLDTNNVSLSLKKKIIANYDFDQFKQNSSILTPPLAGNTYELEFLLTELDILIPLLIKISKNLENDLNSLKSSNEDRTSLWSENLCDPQLVESLYFRTKLTLISIYDLFTVLMEKNFV